MKKKKFKKNIFFKFLKFVSFMSARHAKMPWLETWVIFTLNRGILFIYCIHFWEYEAECPGTRKMH
jgi:hypothetical protein